LITNSRTYTLLCAIVERQDHERRGPLISLTTCAHDLAPSPGSSWFPGTIGIIVTFLKNDESIAIDYKALKFVVSLNAALTQSDCLLS